MITFKQFQKQDAKKTKNVPKDGAKGDTEDKGGSKQVTKAYMQFDGEYFILEQPKYFKLGLSYDLPDGKVWFLMDKKKCHWIDREEKKKEGESQKEEESAEKAQGKTFGDGANKEDELHLPK